MKILRYLLFPFSVIYDVITRIRNIFFNKGFFKQTSFNIPIIVVGNLSVGGTGKTPQIEYLIRLLKNQYKLAVLSRGYKRKTKGHIFLDKSHTTQDVGDEPMQFFNKFSDIYIAVNENRVEGIQQLMKNKSPDIILLDDAFQHRKVKGSFYILLTKYNDLFIDDYLLPTGNLRENKNGAKRADVIVVSKCPTNLSYKEQIEIKNRLRKYGKPVFFSSISYNNNLKGTTAIGFENMQEYKVLLVTGIANPTPLVNFLNEKNISFKHLKYKDHHHFSKEEIDDIQNKFNAISSNKKLILTTEKDYTRLVGKIKNIFYLEIETTFLNNENKLFSKLITDHIKMKNR